MVIINIISSFNISTGVFNDKKSKSCTDTLKMVEIWFSENKQNIEFDALNRKSTEWSIGDRTKWVDHEFPVCYDHIFYMSVFFR